MLMKIHLKKNIEMKFIKKEKNFQPLEPLKKFWWNSLNKISAIEEEIDSINFQSETSTSDKIIKTCKWAKIMCIAVNSRGIISRKNLLVSEEKY